LGKHHKTFFCSGTLFQTDLKTPINAERLGHLRGDVGSKEETVLWQSISVKMSSEAMASACLRHKMAPQSTRCFSD